MLFNSIDFLIFFPIVVLIYFVIPKCLRHIWLLLSSYYFYMSWNPKYALLIAASTIITYVSGLLLSNAHNIKKRKLIVSSSVLSNLGILIIFKYANFIISSINIQLHILGIQTINHRLDLLLPVGISFYTFQALSYTIDVYRGSIEAEKNIINYALFVSFFPQLVAGPIERSGHLLSQITQVDNFKLWNPTRITDGLLLMFWGLFQKLVIADRASIFVNNAYSSYQNYGFIELFTASVLFSIQIYCDFAGYTNIARGAAKVMGFDIIENFRQPYFATSIKDFWRRWHISLTSWFTDYLYIPLGGSKKGALRKCMNIFIVFAVSGLWHGASFHFIAWGIIHAIYQIIGNVIAPIKEKYALKSTYSQSAGARIRHIIPTFILVNFAWIFFAADGISQAFGIIKSMFSNLITSNIYDLGLDRGNWNTLIAATILLLFVDIIHEKKKSITTFLNSNVPWLKMLVFLALIWTTIMLGIYGTDYDTSQFIYFQF